MSCTHRDIHRLVCRGCGRSLFEIDHERPAEPVPREPSRWVIVLGIGGAVLAWGLVLA